MENWTQVGDIKWYENRGRRLFVQDRLFPLAVLTVLAIPLLMYWFSIGMDLTPLLFAYFFTFGLIWLVLLAQLKRTPVSIGVSEDGVHLLYAARSDFLPWEKIETLIHSRPYLLVKKNGTEVALGNLDPSVGNALLCAKERWEEANNDLCGHLSQDAERDVPNSR